MRRITSNGRVGDSRQSIGAAALNTFREKFYRTGMTRNQVADESGNSYSTICHYLKQGKITQPSFNHLMAALMAVDAMPPRRRLK